MAETRSRNDYREVEVLQEPDGVVAIITKREGTEYLSFSMAKNFERDGKTHRTSFLNRRHIASVRRLLVRVEELLDTHVDASTARKIGRPRQ